MTPIVYLHGFASSPLSSKAQYFRERLVAAGASVTVPDLAAGDFAHLTITRQLDVVERASGDGPVRLIGSSLGGYLAGLYAARRAEVERLVLLAPAFGFHRHWAERLGSEEMRRWQREDSLEVYHYGAAATRRLSYQLMEDAARYEDFPDFRQPALIFHGVHDDVVPARYAEAFAGEHPNARLELLDSGHDLLNVLDLIRPRIVEFLCGD